MLSAEAKIVTYVNKKSERSTYPLSSAMESKNLEMVKRLKYTKDILTSMMNNNNPSGNGGNNIPEIGGGLPINTRLNTKS